MSGRDLFFRVLIFVVFGGAVAVGIAGYFFLKNFSPMDMLERQLEAQRVAHYRAKAEEWDAFCEDYDCSDIPTGYVVLSALDQTYQVPHWSRVSNEDACRLTADDGRVTHYEERIFQKGASIDGDGFWYSYRCPTELEVTSTRWDGRLTLYAGTLRKNEPGRRFSEAEVLGEIRGEKLSAGATLASGQPATDDFVLLDDQEDRRVYLSTDRLFQGRHVALICDAQCDAQTVSFSDDPDLITLHLKETIQFGVPGCRFSDPVWTCDVPWDAYLTSMASYIRFVDAELEGSKRPPLATIQ